mgnify:CR=1 FL=1
MFQAIIELQKAHELDPKDRNTLISLKQLYLRINDQDKYKEVKAKLDGI